MYCFVTGAGSKQVMNIHHRQSTADAVPEPVPGFLAGGPNADQNEYPDCEAWNGCPKYPFPKGTRAAMSYVDQAASYASNEVAINWNAPLVFLTGAFEALQKVEVAGVKKITEHYQKQLKPVIYDRQIQAFTIELPFGYKGSASVVDLSGKIVNTTRFSEGGSIVLRCDNTVKVVMVAIDAFNGFGEKMLFTRKMLVE
jgi:hypothetical protein